MLKLKLTNYSVLALQVNSVIYFNFIDKSQRIGIMNS